MHPSLCCLLLSLLPVVVFSSSLADPAKSHDETSDLIHPKAVRVEMTATKYWDFNDRQEHINGMKLDVIDGPIDGCPQQDFHVPCSVGGQSFTCQVDTGSTSLGIATTACTSCGGVKSFYNPSGATLLSTGDMKSTFGDGSGWTGNAYQDVAAVSTSTSTSMVLVGITTQNRFFPAYDYCNFGKTALKYSAIMGFGGPAIGISNGNGVQSNPWFRQYAAASGAPAIFTLRMCLNNGDLWLSGYNNATFTDQLHWVNIQRLGRFAPGQAFYTVAVECIGIQGGANDCNGDDFQNGVNTIVDSGTTQAILPAAVYNNIISQLNNIPQFTNMMGTTASVYFANGNCIQPAGNTSIQALNAVLPKITVQIGGADSGISLMMTLNGVNFYLMQVVSQGKIFLCPGINNNAVTIGSGTVILGWSFMNQFIVAHDLTTNKVGFAPRVGCADVSNGGGAMNNMVGGDVNVKDATGSLGISATGANPGNQGVATPGKSNTVAIAVGVSVAVVVVIGIIIGVMLYNKRNQSSLAMNTMQQQQQQPQATWASAPPPAYNNAPPGYNATAYRV